MTDRNLLWRWTFAATLAALWVLPAAGQTPASDGPWTMPRMPDGRPDLQAVWTNGTITPFERGNEIPYSGVVVPPSAAGKTVFTEEESARHRWSSTRRMDGFPSRRRPRRFENGTLRASAMTTVP